MVTEVDHAYVSKHHATLTAWFAEAMAAIVEAKPDDPIAFLRQQLIAEQESTSEQIRSLELEQLRLILESERSERELLEQRLSNLERLREAGQLSSSSTSAAGDVSRPEGVSAKQADGNARREPLRSVADVDGRTGGADGSRGTESARVAGSAEADVASGSSDYGQGATPDGSFSFGWAAVQGRRPSMEDAHILGIELAPGHFLFAVLDGHAGRRAVERIVEWLPDALRAAAGESTAVDAPLLSAEQIRTALLGVDARLLELAAAEGNWNDGATALLAIVSKMHVQMAQVGDSQAALCSIGSGGDLLCPQHRIGDPREDARLEALGSVVEDGRLIGDGCAVAVTRSLGDAGMKHGSGLTAEPDVSEHPLSPADECLILGCDGLWDVMTAEEVWDVATKAGKGRGGWDYAAAAKALVDTALDRKTGDNVTVVVIGLRKPKVQQPPPATGSRPQAKLRLA